jgi:Prenyltransferase and squalene oxidase repeat
MTRQVRTTNLLLHTPLLHAHPCPPRTNHFQKKKGAFGAHPGHDAHILSTLSAIQVLATPDALSRVNKPRAVDCSSPLISIYTLILQMTTGVVTVILGLQHPSGVFAGDAFGETDTRFLYCAVSALSLLGALDCLDHKRTVSYLISCRNFDGVGRIAGSESHAAHGMSLPPSHSPKTHCAGAPLSSDTCLFLSFYCFYYYYIPFPCSVGTAALAILDRLDVVDLPTLG